MSKEVRPHSGKKVGHRWYAENAIVNVLRDGVKLDIPAGDVRVGDIGITLFADEQGIHDLLPITKVERRTKANTPSHLPNESDQADVASDRPGKDT